MDSDTFLFSLTLCRGAQRAPVFPFRYTFRRAKKLRRGDRLGRLFVLVLIYYNKTQFLFHKTAEILLQSQQSHDIMHPSRNKKCDGTGRVSAPRCHKVTKTPHA